MQGFFDGFDKVRLLLGTSVFYVLALVLIAVSLLINEAVGLRKSSEFHKNSNLPVRISEVVKDKVTFSEVSLGYTTSIELSDDVTFEFVANKINVFMHDEAFEPVSLVMNCSKVDCWIKFTSVEDEHRGLALMAVTQLVNQINSKI